MLQRTNYKKVMPQNTPQPVTEVTQEVIDYCAPIWETAMKEKGEEGQQMNSEWALHYFNAAFLGYGSAELPE